MPNFILLLSCVKNKKSAVRCQKYHKKKWSFVSIPFSCFAAKIKGPHKNLGEKKSVKKNNQHFIQNGHLLLKHHTKKAEASQNDKHKVCVVCVWETKQKRIFRLVLLLFWFSKKSTSVSVIYAIFHAFAAIWFRNANIKTGRAICCTRKTIYREDEQFFFCDP